MTAETRLSALAVGLAVAGWVSPACFAASAAAAARPAPPAAARPKTGPPPTAAATAGTSAPVVVPPPSLRFLALGDSYTIGERVAAAARWPVQLAALLRASGTAVGEPEIVARTGWTVEDLAVALERSEPSGPFDLVSLQIGVNDQYGGRRAEEYRGELRVLLGRAVALAGGHAGRVLVLSIPDWSVTPFAASRSRPEVAAEIARFNAVDREETARAGARWVDVTPESRDAAKEPALLADDGLHPAAAMYAAWARLALAPALAALGRPAAAPAGSPPSH